MQVLNVLIIFKDMKLEEISKIVEIEMVINQRMSLVVSIIEETTEKGESQRRLENVQ